MVDGGYTLFVNQLIELSSQKGIDFNNSNFIYPIKKDINVDLNADERHFNDVFGSFRSKVENQFSEIAHHKLWETKNFEFPYEAKLIDIVIKDSSEDDIPKFNEKKRRRKVKWKNYGHKHNSWLSSDKFNEKDSLLAYIEKHNIDIEL
ncbi:hypothetical protein INT45_002777 [Circinella minor]|uniref:Chromo domain-containing protein n=1 Tax=Circinella minor TaxID=1195481 RepID=A0A8H7RT34_9FUNG|nr:hypothetical protein INT45_002777 [Circinella minor]